MRETVASAETGGIDSRRFSSCSAFSRDLLGHARLLDLLLELVDLVGAVVLLAELLVDRLDLLVEVVLLLGLLHLLLDLDVDPPVEIDLLDLDLEQVLEPLEPLVGRQQLEQRLLLGGRDRQVRRQRVGEPVGVVELQGRQEALEGEVLRQLGVLLEGAEDLVDEELELLRHRVLDLVGLEVAPERAFALLEVHELAALHALDHHLDVAVRELQVLDHRATTPKS